MTNTTKKYIAVWRFIGRYERVMTRSKKFSSEAKARSLCQKMKRAGCLDATFKEVK